MDITSSTIRARSIDQTVISFSPANHAIIDSFFLLSRRIFLENTRDIPFFSKRRENDATTDTHYR